MGKNNPSDQIISGNVQWLHTGENNLYSLPKRGYIFPTTKHNQKQVCNQEWIGKLGRNTMGTKKNLASILGHYGTNMIPSSIKKGIPATHALSNTKNEFPAFKE